MAVLSGNDVLKSWLGDVMSADERTQNFLVDYLKITSVNKIANMPRPAVKRIFEMMKDPPKVPENESGVETRSSTTKYVEDRAYDLDPQSYARFRASFDLGAHYLAVNFAEITVEMMSGPRLDDWIEKSEEYEASTQETKDASLMDVPQLCTDTPEGREKLLVALEDYMNRYTVRAGKVKIPAGIAMRPEATPTRDDLADDSCLAPGCATLADEYFKYCLHEKLSRTGHRFACQVLQKAYAKSPTILSLFENEAKALDTVGAAAEIRKADEEDVVKQDIFDASKKVVETHHWNNRQKLPTWNNLFNSHVKKMKELAPSLDLSQAPTDAMIKKLYLDSLKRETNMDFVQSVFLCRNDKNLSLEAIQKRLAKAAAQIKRTGQTNHEVEDAMVAGVEGGDAWGDEVRLGKSGVVLGCYYPKHQFRVLTPAQQTELQEYTAARKAARVEGRLPLLKDRHEQFCKNLLDTIKATQKAGKKGKGSPGGGKRKQDAGNDAQSDKKKLKTVVASVKATEKQNKALKKQIEEMQAKLKKLEQSSDASIGAAEATPAEEKHVRIADAQGAAKLKSALKSVQKIQKNKQGSGAGSGSEP